MPDFELEICIEDNLIDDIETWLKDQGWEND